MFTVKDYRSGNKRIIEFAISCTWWPWLLLSAITAAFRLVNIGQESLWYDEAFTSMLTRLDWPNMLAGIHGDVHPPAWYVLEWLNVRLFGNSEIALRMPSALLSIIAVLLVWRIALLLKFDWQTALLAGVIAALLPGVVYYGQEARMYMLLSVFVLWAVWAAIREKWIALFIACTGALYTQNLGVFYVAAIGLAIVVSRFRTRRNLVQPAVVGIGIILAWFPWLPTVLYQAAAVKQGFWMQPLTLGGILWPLPAMMMGIRLSVIFQMHVYAAAVGLTIVSLVVGRRWLLSQDGSIVLAACLGTAVLVALVSLLWRAIYLPRAFVPAALLLSLVWAYALRHLSLPNRRVAHILFIPAFGVALISHYFPAGSARYPVNAWAAIVRDGWRPADVVYHIAIDTDIMYQYYLPDKPTFLLPESTDLSQSLTAETKVAVGLKELHFDRLADAGYRRAWLILSTTPLTSQVELDEITRIKGLYQGHLVKWDGNEYAQEAIYLIDLDTL